MLQRAASVVARLLLVPILVAASGCTRTEYLPATPLPAETGPLGGAEDAPAAGFTRVLADADRPARIERIADLRVRHGGSARDLVCERTPCSFVLPSGDHTLLFTPADPAARAENEGWERTSDRVVVHAQGDRIALRHAFGKRHEPGSIEAGLAVIGLGIVGIAVGVGVGAQGAKTSSSDLQTAGGAVAAGSLGAIALGSVLIAAAPMVEQPGSTREWTPPVSAGPSAGVGLRF